MLHYNSEPNSTTEGKAVLTTVLDRNVTHGQLTLHENGTFTYIHDGSKNFRDCFTYHVFDGRQSSETITVRIAINSDHITPKQSPNVITVREGEVSSVLDSGEQSLLPQPHASDSPKQKLQTILDTPPTYGQLILRPDGTFNYTHDGTETTADSFSYHIIDGLSHSKSQEVHINIIPQNYQRIIVSDHTISLETGTETELSEETLLLPIDTSKDYPQDLYNITLDRTPEHGNLHISDKGHFHYSHNGDSATEDSFTYHLNDGIADSNIATVKILIDQPIPSYPYAQDNSIHLPKGGTTDHLDGNRNNILPEKYDGMSAILLDSPMNGILTLNPNGTFSYTHDGSNNQQDCFTYYITDGTNDSNIATITITTTPQSHEGPIVNDDTLSVMKGGNLTVMTPARSSLLFDQPGPRSGGAKLDITLLDMPTHGSVELNSDGTFSYTHDGSNTTVDYFTYYVSDGSCDSNVAIVEIKVEDSSAY